MSDVRDMKPENLVVSAKTDDWQMVCPYCGFEYVHHGDVFIFRRDHEDGPTAMLTTEDKSPTWRYDHGYVNPSPRRDGLYIQFWCESGHHWTLEIYQHKGATFLNSWLLTTDDGAEEPLETMPYARYLKTQHWQAVRQAALERAEHRCQVCNTDEKLHVHHRTYENRGAERDSDVIVLCKPCHERFHGVTNGRVTRTVR